MTLFKTNERLAARKRKDARLRQRRAERRTESRKVDLELRKNRRIAFDRDGGKCRAFGVRLFFDANNVKLRSQAHHMIRRSAGRNDHYSNLLTLSAEAHALELSKLLWIDGDPNGTIHFTRVNTKQEIIEEWSSMCPHPIEMLS